MFPGFGCEAELPFARIYCTLFSPCIYGFLSFAHFFYGVACLFLIDFQELFMYLGGDTLLVVWVANISSQTEACISCFIDGVFC